MAKAVGQPFLMPDGAERVKGTVTFAGNFEVAGMLHGKILRSPHAHARIVKLDASRAAQLRGVIAVLTGADLDGTSINSHYGPVLPDRPLVAIDKVRFHGEPVAAVAAVDEDTAQEAIDLIEVEYEELPAMIAPDQAIAPDAPPIHDSIARRDFLTYPDIVLNTEAGKNIFNYYRLRRGDAERGFREADEVFEDTFRTPHQQHVSLEPHLTLARIDGDHVTLWSTAASPYTAQFQVAETLRLPKSKVRVIVHNIGGAYGGKTYPRHEPLVAALSWKAGGRPVRVALSRAEEFYTITRHASITTIRTGVKRDGQMVARHVHILWGAGAYADVSPRLIKNGGYGSPGPYNIPHIAVDSYAVYTNTTPSGGFRGYSIPQVAWAYESHLDTIAHALGIDPLEMRLRNVMRSGDPSPTNQVFDDLHYPELLEAAAEAVDWGATSHQEGRLKVGRGIACTYKGTITPSTSTASIKMSEDGSATVLTATTEIGQGSRTILAQMAADELRLPFDRVRVSFADTDVAPWDQTTSSSRSTYMMGTAVTRAAEDVRQQLTDIAAGLLEAAPEDVVLEEGRAHVRGTPEKAVDYAGLIRGARQGNILGSGTFKTEGQLDPDTGLGIATCHMHQCTAAAEVEVDTETGQVRIPRLRVASYAGKVINPTLASLQMDGNVAFGVGQSLLEEMIYDGGLLSNPNLSDYMIPSIKDLPDHYDNILLEHPAGLGEPHGLGEGTTAPVPAAIGNAIFDAVGVRIHDLPITPEKILRGLKDQPASKP
ncbi:MAG TPA: xanthine dehydrogenase family protein molybdopterin-binding subunit [Chloroflexota bacterium]|nr:xanthine dehydrogenase family protein molybdopterin-binding subunit [Chloroflexota bacterium]